MGSSWGADLKAGFSANYLNSLGPQSLLHLGPVFFPYMEALGTLWLLGFFGKWKPYIVPVSLLAQEKE